MYDVTQFAHAADAQGQVDLPHPGAVYGLRGSARVALGDHAGALEDLERLDRELSDRDVELLITFLGTLTGNLPPDAATTPELP